MYSGISFYWPAKMLVPQCFTINKKQDLGQVLILLQIKIQTLYEFVLYKIDSIKAKAFKEVIQAFQF